MSSIRQSEFEITRYNLQKESFEFLDIEHGLISSYFRDYINDLGIDMHRFLALGASPGNHGSFNQTAFALRGSRFHNRLRRIPGGVASEMEHYIWPEVPHREDRKSTRLNSSHVKRTRMPSSS